MEDIYRAKAFGGFQSHLRVPSHKKHSLSLKVRCLSVCMSKVIRCVITLLLQHLRIIFLLNFLVWTFTVRCQKMPKITKNSQYFFDIDIYVLKFDIDIRSDISILIMDIVQRYRKTDFFQFVAVFCTECDANIFLLLLCLFWRAWLFLGNFCTRINSSV